MNNGFSKVMGNIGSTLLYYLEAKQEERPESTLTPSDDNSFGGEPNMWSAEKRPADRYHETFRCLDPSRRN